MHPVFSSRKRLITTGLLWGPITFLVVLLMHSLLNISWLQAVTLVFLPMILKFFLCTSIWYLSRSTRITKFLKSLLIHIFASIIINSIWLLLIYFYTRIIDYISKGNFWVPIFTRSLPIFFVIGISLYFIATLTFYLIIEMEKTKNAEKDALYQKVFAARSELEALKVSVHPHFLFNCLTMIGPLIKKSPNTAQDIIDMLAEFLLYSLRYGKKESVSVREEVEHIENYLKIEKVRFGNRLDLKFDIDKRSLDCLLMPLTLIPLIENAIKHGISQSLNGGKIETIIKKENRKLLIKIVNPYEVPEKSLAGESLGLGNLRKRILSRYKNLGSLNTEIKDNKFIVEIILPLEGKCNE